jgi:hypothetical protein
MQDAIHALPNASSIYCWTSIRIEVLSFVLSLPTYTKRKIRSHKNVYFAVVFVQDTAQ